MNQKSEPVVNWQQTELTVQQACDLALQALGNGNRDNAKALYELIARAAPRHADAVFHLGQIAEAEGNLELALDYYTQAMRLYPGFSVYELNRGRILHSLQSTPTI